MTSDIKSIEKTINSDVSRDLPQPIVPNHVDLRDLKTLPIEIERLQRSVFWKKSTATEFKAALSLWMAAWHEVPAASLPNDERLLADMASVTLKKWRGARVHPMALYGFVLCSDNRFYHPVLAEKAIYLWNSRLNRSSIGKAAATKRWNSGRTSSEISHEISSDMATDKHDDIIEKVIRVSNENNDLLMREALPEQCVGNAMVKNGKNGKEEEIDTSVGVLSLTTKPDMPVRAARANKTYVFEGKVVRLNEKDYALWLKSFRNIPNLLAELLKRDAWLVSQPEKDRAKWFQSTSAWLTRLDRELAPLPDTMGGFPTVLQEKLKSNPEETLMEMLKPIWKGNAKFKTPEETLACFRDWVDDAKLAAYIMLAKTRCPKDILPIKLVHMLAYQGTDPADNRPWQNGYPPPAKSKPAETEQQSDRRRRAENRYGGLNV